MLKISLLLIATAVLAAAPSAVIGALPNKCVINGTVTYQQEPCPSTQPRKEPTLNQLNAAEKKRRAVAASAEVGTRKDVTSAPTAVRSGFSCDGRQHCSQMKSCEEAKYFLANCPAVKMDGDKNGTPCEQQWCFR